MKGTITVFLLTLTTAEMIFIDKFLNNDVEVTDSQMLKDALKKIGHPTDKIYVISISKTKGLLENQYRAVYLDENEKMCNVQWIEALWSGITILDQDCSTSLKGKKKKKKKTESEEEELREKIKDTVAEDLEKYKREIEELKEELRQNAENSERLKEIIEEMKNLKEKKERNKSDDGSARRDVDEEKDDRSGEKDDAGGDVSRKRDEDEGKADRRNRSHNG